MVTKKNIIIALAIAWVVFSAWYMINDQWQNYKIGQIEKAYIAGGNNTITTIVNESTKCQPIPLFSGENEVKMIAIECLQQAQGDNTQASE
jgi:hypothetical protein